MAGKNEIKHRLTLEGDDEIKSKLKAVGEAGKQSLEHIEKSFNNAGGAGEKFAEKLTRPLTLMRKAFAPFLEGAGINAIAEGGVIGNLFGVGGSAAAISALGAIALHLAKVSEEAQATDKRFRGLGGGAKALDQLNDSAKKLGGSPSDLKEGFEDFLASRRANQVNNTSVQYAPGHEPDYDELSKAPKVFQGGRLTSGPGASNETFLAAQRTLANAASVDQKDDTKRNAAINEFTKSINKNGGITAEALNALKATSPNAANTVAKDVGRQVYQSFPNSDYLAKYINTNGPIPLDKSFKGLENGEADAKKEADAARGVSDAFSTLKASAGRLDEAFGKLAGSTANKASTTTIDKVSGGIDKAAELVEEHVKEIQDGASLGYKLGNKVPFLGPLTGVLGGAVGAGVGALSSAEQETEKTFPKTVPFDALKDFIHGNAIEDRGPRRRLEPEENPNPTETPSTIPLPRARPENLGTEQHSAITPDQAQQFAGLGDNIKAALETVVAKINESNPKSNKVEGPVSGIGIRGEAPPSADAPKLAALDGASVQAASSVSSLDKASADAAASLSRLASAGPAPSGASPSPSSSSETTTAAASGGLMLDSSSGYASDVPKFADGGRLTDNEYGIEQNRKLKQDEAEANAAAERRKDDERRREQEQERQQKQNRKLDPDHYNVPGNWGPKAVIDSLNEASMAEGQRDPNFIPIIYGSGGGYAGGGRVSGPGGTTEDAVNAKLSHGEYVVRASETAKHLPLLQQINAGKLKKAFGGLIEIPRFSEGGPFGALPGITSPGMVPNPGNIAANPMEAAGYHAIDMRTNMGDYRVMAPEHVARSMGHAARDAANAQTGERPSWYRGK